MIGALVPIKDFANAKQRLESLLSPGERHRLAEAMLRDVLGALAGVSELDLVAMVTKDAQAAMIAREMNGWLIGESENRGETEAVALAVDVLIGRGVQAMLVIPGDVPLAREEDVRAIIRAGRSADVVLVPSRDERGTNAVLLSPPSALPLRFGNDSFYPHLEAARWRGLRTRVLQLPTMALDIDTPNDLIVLANSPARTRTHRLLEQIGWESRCK